MIRYFWSASSDWRLHELIDSTSARVVATIEQVDDLTWKWERTTTLAEHGAPPAQGTAANLVRAKIAVIQDLPEV